MVLAALYIAVLVGGAILLGIFWVAYKGLAYLWHQWFRTDEQMG